MRKYMNDLINFYFVAGICTITMVYNTVLSLVVSGIILLLVSVYLATAISVCKNESSMFRSVIDSNTTSVKTARRQWLVILIAILFGCLAGLIFSGKLYGFLLAHGLI